MSTAVHRLHWFNSPAQPPACGQKDRTGNHYLPVRRTTEDEAAVTCGKCQHRMGWQEKQDMQAWCGPGESVQEMLARAVERDSS